MADRPMFTLDTEGGWRLAYDSNQWILQRRKGPARPANRSGIADTGWRGVSFIGSEKRILHRCIREHCIVLAPEAGAQLDALPDRFLDFLTAPRELSPPAAPRRAA